jgi:serine/threonine protein kinase/WD40 repeat protein
MLHQDVLPPDDEGLLALAVAIADGTPIDWAASTPSNADAASSSVLVRLRCLERLVRGHETVRTQPGRRKAASAHDTLLTEARRKTVLRPDQPLHVQWGPLIVYEKIGRGSFGDVYRARDPRLDREVALKLVPEDATESVTSPVVEEGRLLARIRHPNVLAVYGAERIDGRVGIWTEYVRGETLADEIARRGPVSPDEATRIGIDVCRALGAVHEAGLLHRDVKAQNILRDATGRLVLGDFGTGVELDEHAGVAEAPIAGTLLYLAPELFERLPATVGSDLYSVGVLLYFLVTGTYPVRGRTFAEIRRAHTTGARLRLREARADLPERFIDVVEALLGTGSDRGYGTAAAAERALGARLAERAEPESPAAVDAPATTQARRRAVVVFIAALVTFTGAAIASRFLKAVPTIPSPAPAGQAARQLWRGEGVDGRGAPSPDGRYLSFTDWETGDLAVRDFMMGTSRRLTDVGGWEASGDYAMESVISPDGRHVAYGWFVEKAFKNELRVVSLTTGDPAGAQVILRTERSDFLEPFAWTPDGRQLLVVRTRPDRTTHIGIVSIQDGSFQSLKSLGWHDPNRLSLSPNGQYVAYDLPAGDNGASRDIFVLALDGRRETAVVQSPANDASPFWSPDSSQVLFLSDRTANTSLWTVSVEGGRPKGPPSLVKADIGPINPLGMTRSGALHYLLSGATRPNIYFADLETMRATKPPVLATERFINANTGPEWSRDGRYLAYYSFRNPPVLVIRSPKTGEERDIPLPASVASPFRAGPKWFPDNDSVLVLSRDAQGPGFGFYRLAFDSGKLELLTHLDREVSSFDLSPDGRTIFYVFQHSLTGRLMRFDINSHRETELKKNEWFIAVAVSPDGTELAYLKSVRTPGAFASVVEVMPVAGGQSREVFRGEHWLDGSRYNTLAWTPDQRFLLFVRDGGTYRSPSVLWRVSVAGGEPESVGISMEARIKSPRVHPDGKRIAFGAVEQLDNEIWALENFLPRDDSRH